VASNTEQAGLALRRTTMLYESLAVVASGQLWRVIAIPESVVRCGLLAALLLPLVAGLSLGRFHAGNPAMNTGAFADTDTKREIGDSN
jgi:hypothetical protein